MDDFSFDDDVALIDQETDKDYALALQLHLEQQDETEQNTQGVSAARTTPNSIIDGTWEQLDPSPDLRGLFMQFNARYFWGKLDGVEVRWSPRMTLCAGLCSYEGHGGLCSVRLSEPLLKLRPRRDLVETLLHEMIHAFLFITRNNKDHDDHGPEFHKHMKRINDETGTKISVFHTFHDEVDFYRTHWWQCDGRCRSWKPYFGIVRRAMNRPPAPRDPWFADHLKRCGGTFVKIKEPENTKKRPQKRKLEKPVETDAAKKSRSPIVPFSGKGHVLGSSSSGRPPLRPVLQPQPTTSASASSSTYEQATLTDYFTNASGRSATNGNASGKSTSVDNRYSSADARRRDPSFRRDEKKLPTKTPAVTNQRQGSKAQKDKRFLKTLFTEYFDDADDCQIVETSNGNEESANGRTSHPSATPKSDSVEVDVGAGSSLERSNERDTCSCPVCGQKIDANLINEHLDGCLLCD